MIRKIKYQLKKKRKIEKSYLFLLGMVSLFLLVGGFSYAMFTAETERRGTLNIITGNLYSFLESKELNQQHQLVLASGESKIITITLTNVNPIDAKFHLWYEAVEGVNVSYDETKDIPPTKEGFSLVTNGKKTYRFNVRNDTLNTQTITFGSEVGLSTKTLSFPEGKKVVELTIPKVTVEEGLIPVVYNGSTWVKADRDNWYDYDNGKWANAVTVTSASRSKYQSASDGVEVMMDDIETMWVYIPRYSYTIGSEDGTNYYGKQGAYLESSATQALPGEIDIKFINKTEKDTGSAQYKVSEGVSGWRTPDAFTFGEKELAGIWVGKFETSSSDSTVAFGGGNTVELDPMIKPNITSWKNIQVSNLAEVGRKVSASGNRYGIDISMDSHAMKNSEWAVVAYLSQSKYGKLGNQNYHSANKEIYMNRSDQFITGCSYGAPGDNSTNYGCHYTYDKSLEGTGASTTGTIEGIYDISGGSFEFMLSNYAPNGNRYAGGLAGNNTNSGYTGLLEDGTTFHGKDWLDDKYYNFYSSKDEMTACSENPCISHSLHETKGWYEEWFVMPKETHSFALRSSRYYEEIGNVFGYSNNPGQLHSHISFRLVLIEN